MRVVLAWRVGRDPEPDADLTESWETPSRLDPFRGLPSTAPLPARWSRRAVESMALAPSVSMRPAALLHDAFDPKRLVKHPVTVLDLGRGGIHLVVRLKPERGRDHWLGIDEGSGFVWSKVLLRSLSEPTLGAFLARFSFAGPCPYELIRRAIQGRPAGPVHEKKPRRMI